MTGGTPLRTRRRAVEVQWLDVRPLLKGSARMFETEGKCNQYLKRLPHRRRTRVILKRRRM